MQRRSSPLSLFITFLIIVGTLAGLKVLMVRWHVERANRRVELGLEYSQVAELAEFNGISVQSALQQFKANDVSALIITEDTVNSLELSGVLRPSLRMVPGGRITVVTVSDTQTLHRVVSELQMRGVPFTSCAVQAVLPSGHTLFTDGTTGFATPIGYPYLRQFGVGLPPHQLQEAHRAGLLVAGRINNFPGVTYQRAAAVLDELGKESVSLVIFAGNDVLGFRGSEKRVASLLMPDASGRSPSGPLYGNVEFGKQHGAGTISSALNGAYIRVHSIQSAEMANMTEAAMVERFGLAARERNIRFCYVRLLTEAGTNQMAENIHYVNRVAARIAHGPAFEGGAMRFGKAHIFLRLHVPRFMFSLIGLGIAGGMVWMMISLMPLSTRQIVMLLVICIPVFAALPLIGMEGRRLTALAAGIIFPSIACLRAMPRLSQRRPMLTVPSAAVSSITSIILASATTAIGIVAVIGLLASRIFVVEESRFQGIKAQLSLPILLIAVAAVAGGAVFQGETIEQFKIRWRTSIKSVLNEPSRYGTLLIIMFALAVVALILIRSGNDASVAVSPLELKARALLDHVLPVRPRSKEFLLGDPLFIFSVAMYMRGRRKIAMPCFVAATIGQVDLLNTFCHIHTPILISVWRAFLSLSIGIILGLLLFFFVELLFFRNVPEETDQKLSWAK